MVEKLPVSFDVTAWILKCKELERTSVSRSGFNYELFVETFSRAIDRELCLIDAEDDRSSAMKIVTEKFDYVSSDERRDMAKTSKENGYCVHHFEPDYCPLGCGSLE